MNLKSSSDADAGDYYIEISCTAVGVDFIDTTVTSSAEFSIEVASAPSDFSVEQPPQF